jgi:hypothetical protein
MTKASGNKRGRPPKTELKQIKENRSVGRPKGDAAIINEYKLRMLNSPKSSKVLEAIYDAALTDGHPGQTAAWKLIVDRIVPVSAFDTTKQAGGVPQISINISSVGAPKVERLDDIIDVEDKDES